MIPVNPPYLKVPKSPISDLGLQLKNYYTTGDICKALRINPDTLRYRIRAGIYPETPKVGGRRVFTEEQIREIQSLAAELAAELDAIRNDFESRHRLIDMLNLRVTLKVEAGQKIAYVECILGCKPLPIVCNFNYGDVN